MKQNNKSDKNILILDEVTWTEIILSIDSLVIPNLNSSHNIGSDINPEKGQIQLILISKNYNLDLVRDREYYLLYQLWDSSINGYEERCKENISAKRKINCIYLESRGVVR